MNKEYAEFVAFLKSKPEKIAVNSGIFENLMTAVREVGMAADDFKRHLFYGTEIKNVDNKTHRGHAAIEITDPKQIDLLHGVLGIFGEASELFERMYVDVESTVGELDVAHWTEELGDGNFYQQMVQSALALTWEQVFQTNMNKLRKRYPDGFSQDKAVNRDTAAERKILEESVAH